MPTAQQGDAVKIHFTGMLEDGSVFISSVEEAPVEFSIGDGSVLKGINDGVVGMSVGEKRTIKVSPADGYGERIEALTTTVPRDDLPANFNPQVGEVLEIQLPSGEEVMLLIAEVNDDEIILDGNHPYAGKTLDFELELIAIN